MKWIALKETTHCIPNRMREKKTQQAGTSYSSTGLNQMEVFGFAYFFVKIACEIVPY